MQRFLPFGIFVNYLNDIYAGMDKKTCYTETVQYLSSNTQVIKLKSV